MINGRLSACTRGLKAAITCVTKAKTVTMIVKMASLRRNSGAIDTISRIASRKAAEIALQILAALKGEVEGKANDSMCSMAVRKLNPDSQIGKKVDDRWAGRTAATEECTVEVEMSIKELKSTKANSVAAKYDSAHCQKGAT